MTVGQSSAQTLTISNTGNADLSVTGISSSEGQFTVSTTSFSVAAGNSQDVTVTFTPASAGAKTGTITITSNDPDEASVTVSVSGNGTVPAAPDISLSATELSFGDVTVGQPSAQTLTISNAGNAYLSVTNIISTDPQVTVSLASFSVSPGGSQQVTLTYTPSGAVDLSATLLIQSNDPDEGTLTIALSGTGVQPPPSPTPDISLSSTSISFGSVEIGKSYDDLTVGDSGTEVFTLSNVGTADLVVSSIISSTSQFQVNPTSFTVPAGGGQVVTVSFIPTSAGDKTGSLTISHNADGDTSILSLIGKGITSPPAIPVTGTTPQPLAPSISTIPDTLDFGTVELDTTALDSLWIFNLGNIDLRLNGIVVLDGNFSVSAQDLTLQPGDSTSLDVSFTPDRMGAFSTVLEFGTNDPLNSTIVIQVRGQGLSSSTGFEDLVEIPGFLLADLNPANGNQGQKTKRRVKSGDTITLQLFADNFPEITGYGFNIKIKDESLSYIEGSFTPSFIAQPTALATNRKGVLEVGVASFPGLVSSGDGFLGELQFKVESSFADSTTVLLNNLGFSQKNGDLTNESTRLILRIYSSGPSLIGDFDEDGIVGFRDFLMFALAFGSQDSTFDLDGDQHVGFRDFILFAQNYGKTAEDG